MTQSSTANRQVVLAERPSGLPNENTLKLESSSVPAPSDGEMLLRTEYLSLDPYMRGRMNDAKSYATPVQIGEPMVGGTVAEVVESKIEGYSKGDYVLCGNGWQDYGISNGLSLIHI